MDKRLATSDPVKIIDSKSPDFGKTGKVMTIKSVPVIMLKGEPQKEEIRILVKLDDTDKPVWFLSHQFKKTQ